MNIGLFFKGVYLCKQCFMPKILVCVISRYYVFNRNIFPELFFRLFRSGYMIDNKLSDLRAAEKNMK